MITKMEKKLLSIALCSLLLTPDALAADSSLSYAEQRLQYHDVYNNHDARMNGERSAYEEKYLGKEQQYQSERASYQSTYLDHDAKMISERGVYHENYLGKEQQYQSERSSYESAYLDRDTKISSERDAYQEHYLSKQGNVFSHWR